MPLSKASHPAELVCALQLAESKDLKLDHVRHFILDECDKVLDTIGELPACLSGRSNAWLGCRVCTHKSPFMTCMHGKVPFKQ